MYFFYIDESGGRDLKKDEPYVLAAVGMYENQWYGFNRHLMGMKTNIARKYDSDLRQDHLEVKANLLTKPKARENDPVFKYLTLEDITHISNHYYDQLDRSKMDIVVVVVDKAELDQTATPQKMHKKAYEMLVERINTHMQNNYPKHNALIIMDDTDAKLNRSITSIHSRLLNIGNENMKFRNITEFPFLSPANFQMVFIWQIS